MSQPELKPIVHNVNRLRRVLDATKLLHSTIDIAELTRIILGMVRDEVGVDRCTVFVVDKDRREIISLVAQDAHGSPIRLSSEAGSRVPSQ